MYYPSSENKGADQLRSYCEADLRLCFRIYADCWISHEAAQISFIVVLKLQLHLLRVIVVTFPWMKTIPKSPVEQVSQYRETLVTSVVR